MNMTRRNVLKLFGGVTAGAILSPMPWKLIDDVSIWTQNWPWTARPLRGPVTYGYTTCTLCPAGCGLRVRRIGSFPVSAWPVPGHPVSEGRVCPAGLGAAQIRFHPARIGGAARRDSRQGGTPWRLVDRYGAVAEVGRKLAVLHAANAMDRVGILDLRPGRALSTLYREFLAHTGGGRYLTLPGGRESCATALAGLVETSGASPVYDFASAGSLISFGAPLFDGWAGAGPAPGLVSGRNGEREESPFVIQVESNASTTAMQSDRWIPVRPGTEAAVALGLAHVLLNELPNDHGIHARARELENGPWPGYIALVSRFTPEETARTAGIEPKVVRSTARELAVRQPVIAVGGGDQAAGPLGDEEERIIWSLNLLLSGVRRPGGVGIRDDLLEVFDESGNVACESLWEVPDGSLDLLIVDGSLPGTPIPRDLLRRKTKNAESLMVGLSPFAAGPAGGADIILPTPAPGEWLDDIPPLALAPRNSYALSPVIAEPPEWASHPADLLHLIAGAAGLTAGPGSGKKRHERLLKSRVSALYSRSRGKVFDPERDRSVKADSLGSAERLFKVLAAGGCWTEPADRALADLKTGRSVPGRVREPRLDRSVVGRAQEPAGEEKDYPLVLMLSGGPAAGGGVLPPVVNKLYRESNLKSGPRRAHVNPVTARERRLGDLRPAELKTAFGKMTVAVVHDESVMPGVVRISPGPDPVSLGDPDNGDGDILEICGAARRPVWRVTRASLREV